MRVFFSVARILTSIQQPLLGRGLGTNIILRTKGCMPETVFRNSSKMPSAPTMERVTKVVDNIVKSPEDKRAYECLELCNGLKVLLVSDSTTDKASAALDVHIGHMSDPRDLPGLAHFCEHMLFLGTEKYPEENEYNKYLSEHAGSSNAFTSAEHTNYYFDVAPDHLEGALDRFSQFFLSPLFTPSATEREVNAVNSENDKNLQSDSWRLHQLERSSSDPSHDFSKFGTGNKTTLLDDPKSRGLDVRDELLKFHSKFYSSNIMGFCVLGKESLEELKNMVVPLFSSIEDKTVSVPKWEEHPFGPTQVKLQAHVVPVKDLRNLNVTWPIPDLHEFYKTNPGHYLGHLIGHEGPGSLLSELKNRGWVNTLVGGQKEGANGFMFFIVNVDLSEEGIEHIDDIIKLIFQYMNLLKRNAPQEWVFDECKNLSSMGFRFKDKERPRNLTSSHAALLHDYPMEEVLSGGYLLEEFKSDLISSVLEKLTTDTIRVAVIGKKFAGQTDKTEKWYGTEYSLKSIPEETLQSWSNAGLNDNLSLPSKNEFIPTIFDIIPRDPEATSIPVLLRDTSLSKLWYKQDNIFLMPKSCINIEINSPQAYMDPVCTNLTYMFSELFKDAVNEYAYDAELAGLSYNLNSTIYGLTLNLSGYNDKQLILLQRIMNKMTSFTIDPQRFDVLKEKYIRGLKNFKAEQPHQHAIYYTTLLVSEQLWTKDELLDTMDEVTEARLQAFIPQLFSKIFLEFLVYGNVSKQWALDAVGIVENTLQTQANAKSLLASQQRRFREVQLPDACCFLYKHINEVHKSSSLEVYYQCNIQDTNANVLLELFCQLIAEPCFNILRTQEQLGYIVFSGVRRANGVQGLRVIVQSDRQPDYVEARIEAFLHKMESHIGDMGEDVFNKHVEALATKRLEKPKKLSSQNNKYWSEIISQQYNFDRDTIEVNCLKGLTKEEVLKFFKELIAHDAPRRHKLSVHVASTAAGEPVSPVDVPLTGMCEASEVDGIIGSPSVTQPVEVSDISVFKRQLGLFPLPKSFIATEAKSKL